MVLDQFLDMSENKEVVVEFEKIPKEDEYIDVLAPDTSINVNSFITAVLILSVLVILNVLLKMNENKNDK